MKVIYDDTILGVSLMEGTADAEYPVENVLNEFPRKPFKATGSRAVIRVVDSGGSSCMALFAANADAVTVTSALGMSVVLGSDETALALSLGSDESAETLTLSDRGDVDDYIEASYTKEDDDNGVFWIDFESSGVMRTIDIELIAFSGAVSVGVLAAGAVMRFRDMEHNSYQEAPVDYGFDLELQSGNPFYVDLGRARVFTFYTYMCFEDNPDPGGYNSWWDFYYKLVRSFGKTPRAWLLSERLKKGNYAIWGRLDKMPRSVATKGKSTKFVSIDIKEIN